MALFSLPILALLLVAAGPLDDVRALVQAGQAQQAFELAQREASGGDPAALDLLALFYDEGTYVPQDHVRAASLYRRAAEGGQANAQWRLGVMLDIGEGVAANPREAVEWLRRAAGQGNAEAHASLGVMYANARGVERDYAQSMLYYRRAAELGGVGGFYGIGALYSNGQGVALDRIEAGAWFLAALTQDDRRSEQALGQLDLEAAEMRRAIARANAILEQHRLEQRIRFEEQAEERPPAPLT